MTWPMAIVLSTLIFVVAIAAMMPSITRASMKVEEAKAKGNEGYKLLASDFAKLAEETRAVQAAMKADLEAVRGSVESIETMMRDVG